MTLLSVCVTLVLSGLCRVSCVPTSCFLIWFVSCPCLMSLLVNSCPAVFVSLSMIYLCILVHACSVWCCLVYLLFPVYPVCESCLVLLCPALMSLLNINLSLYPRLRAPVPPSCVHRDRRPDRNRKRRPFTPFCFPFWKVLLCSSVCVSLSRGMEVATRHSRHSPLQVGVGVWRDRRECRESTGREPSCPPIAGDIRRRRWLSRARRHPCLVPGLPLPQARRSREITPPDRLWLNARRPASDSMPAGPPLS